MSKYIVREPALEDVKRFLADYGSPRDYKIRMFERGEYGGPDYYELAVIDPVLDALFIINYSEAAS